MSSSEESFKIWINKSPTAPGQLSFTGATIKTGRRVCKTVTYSQYGNTNTGEVRHRELRFHSYSKSLAGSGYDFSRPESTWYCEDDEVEKLLAFINGGVEETGRYHVIDTAAASASLLSLLESRCLSAGQLVDLLASHHDPGELVSRLATTAAGLTAAQAAVITKRRALIDTLKERVRDPQTSETDMQKLIGQEHWLFGGRYTGVAELRRLTTRDEFDIPLICADHSLHIVELKGPNINKLIEEHRGDWIVGPGVHKAASQAANYLRTLDEQAPSITTAYRNDPRFAYELRRARATVVIGHVEHATGPRDPRLIAETIRSYNTGLNRVEVLTYDELLDAAERTLAFEEAELGATDADLF